MEHRHSPIGVQWRTLVQKLRGHYAYYGVAGNAESLARFLHEVTRVWRTWLSRRSQRSWVTWERMGQILVRYPLPPPRVRVSSWGKSTA